MNHADLDQLDVGLTLPEIDTIVRSRFRVPIVLIEAGCFFTAVESSAEALADALGYNVGTDAWGRQITGIPLQSIEDREFDLQADGYSYAVVVTTGHRGSRPIRVVARVSKGHLSENRTFSRSAARDASRALPEFESDPLASFRSESEYLVARLEPADDASADLITTLREFQTLDKSNSDSVRTELGLRICRLRRELLFRLWEHFLADGDPSHLARATAGLQVEGHVEKGLRAGDRAKRHDYDGLLNDEQADVLDMYFAGWCVFEIAHELARPSSLIRKHLTRVGLGDRARRAWWPDEVKRLETLISRRSPLRDVAATLRRSPWEVALNLTQCDVAKFEVLS